MSNKEELEPLPAALPEWIRQHVELYFSDPERAHRWDSTVAGGPGPLPTLLLIARGAKSGKRRPLPLLYQETDGKYVVIGSKGGAPTHPGWYDDYQKHAGSRQIPVVVLEPIGPA